jgi:hypothetical protein
MSRRRLTSHSLRGLKIYKHGKALQVCKLVRQQGRASCHC